MHINCRARKYNFLLKCENHNSSAHFIKKVSIVIILSFFLAGAPYFRLGDNSKMIRLKVIGIILCSTIQASRLSLAFNS